MDTDFPRLTDPQHRPADSPPILPALPEELLGDGQADRADQPEMGADPGSVQSPSGSGYRAALAGSQNPPVLADSGSPRGSVSTVLSRFDAQLVHAAFADLNRLHRLAEDSFQISNSELEFLATKAALQVESILLKLRHGSTLHINAKITSQRDIPRLGDIPPDKRQQIMDILNMVEGEVIEEDFGEFSETT